MDGINISEVNERLQRGDPKRISDITGLSIYTVRAVLSERKVKPIGENNVIKVLNAAIEIIEERDKEMNKLGDKIIGML